MKLNIIVFLSFIIASCSKNEVTIPKDIQSTEWEDLNVSGIVNDFFISINENIKIAGVSEILTPTTKEGRIYFSSDNCKTWQKLISNEGIGIIKPYKNSYIMNNYKGVFISENLIDWRKITPVNANLNFFSYTNLISNKDKIFVHFDKLYSSLNDGNSWKTELEDIYYMKSFSNTLFVEHNISNAYDYSFDNGTTWKRDSFSKDMGFTFSDAVLTKEGINAVSRFRDSIIFSDYSFKGWKTISAIENNENKKIWKVGNYFILGGKNHYYSKDNCKTWQKFDNPFGIGYYTESVGYLYAHSESRLYRKKIN